MFSIKFELQRSIEIKKPASEIFNLLSNFNTWPDWSPWLCQEPECPVEIVGEPASVGHGQFWDGQRIGTGNLTLSNLEENQKLEYDLQFLKPWKSKAYTAFILNCENDITTVSWSMKSSLPFFMFFMKKKMISWIGSDYDRGLKLLKDLAETGETHNIIEVDDVIDRDGFAFVGKKSSCSLQEMESAMSSVLTDLFQQLENEALPPPDMVLTQYHKVDMVTNICEFTSCFGYESGIPEKVPAGFSSGNIEAHRALNINHTGPYRHLGNAWSAVFGCLESKKLKANKQIPQYEIYLNDPQQVEEKDIKTAILAPIS